MKRFACILCFLLLLGSCSLPEEDRLQPAVPPGTPLTLQIGFGPSRMTSLEVSTKAESADVDECRVHDLYVFIFDNETLEDGSPKKIYGRYFSFEHLTETLEELDAHTHEGWWVENKTMVGVTPQVEKTSGVVKVASVACPNATLVVLANVSTTVVSFNGQEAVGYLNGIRSLDQLRGTSVRLEQQIVNRKDHFLMLGQLQGVNTAHLSWGSLPKTYDESSRVVLKTLDAKVKFMVRANETNISDVRASSWQVLNTPDRCYLFEDYSPGSSPEGMVYFPSETAYFEGTDMDEDGREWHVFTFYMLESHMAGKQTAQTYYDRERQAKADTGGGGYQGPSSETFADHFVQNGNWSFAPDNAPYVRFNVVLTLTDAGIDAMIGDDLTVSGQALTANTGFTVHLGDFGSSNKGNYDAGFNDYNTYRGHAYTYKILINNASSIYAEVVNDVERQPGEEGYLLLSGDEIVNADAHYEYHSLTFAYDERISPEKFSWYVKTPFGEGQPEKMPDPDDPSGKKFIYTADGLDYRWVKFAVNQLEDGIYSARHVKYPGNQSYDPSWKPSTSTVGSHPPLMDINQLIMYLFDQMEKKKEGLKNDYIREGDRELIRITAFIDEYYYETNPLTGEPDRDLWRRFVNAKPREMHVLSDARPSRDRGSDIVYSSHSVVQQSIQTIYNIYAPGLRTIWGCEHVDEMKVEHPAGWPYWPKLLGDGTGMDGYVGGNDEVGRENGRLNTAYIWDLYSSQGESGTDKTGRRWDTYMDFEVDNDTPELLEKYWGMAWSCMTRNRDNNGNGLIDRDEVRWYMASTRQLQGIWVGRESLSPSARLYQPAPGEWRAHVLASNGKMSCWAEEGGAFGEYSRDMKANDSEHTWTDVDAAARGQSVRCVRNVGTYDDEGTLRDISYAPYKQKIDAFYTKQDLGTTGDAAEGPFAIFFDRLDTKSIRDYYDRELPYADQNDLVNRVYVKLITQARSEAPMEAPNPYSVPIRDINSDVTAKGYNPYCPPGYRFPNHTEAILMSLALPGDYFKKQGDGSSSDARYVTRTYYDKGYYWERAHPNNSDPWNVEKKKVGWAVSSNDVTAHCVEETTVMSRSRCVKDENMTGYIDGELLVDDNVLYFSDDQDVTFNFFSTASSLSYASLKLCYTTHNNNYRELDIPLLKMPEGMQYRQTQTVRMPSLSDLGLKLEDLPRAVTLQAFVQNAAGENKTVSLPLTLQHPLHDVYLSFPEEYDAQKAYPIELHASLGGRSLSFDGTEPLVLEWTAGDGQPWNAFTVPASFAAAGSYARGKNTATVYLGDILPAIPDLTGTTYSYRLVAKTSDGVSLASEVKQVQMLKHLYCANPEPDGGWTSSHHLKDLNNKWSLVADGLDFNAGDRLEVMMDLTPCYYVYTGNSGDDGGLGKDHILAIGKTKIDAADNAVLFYYPMVDNVVADPAAQGQSRLRIHAGNWNNGLNIAPVSGTTIPSLAVSLDKGGMYLDGESFTGNPGNWNSVKSGLLSSSSLILGSQEGKHQSRAIYQYIRVIRDGDRTSFGQGGLDDGGRM